MGYGQFYGHVIYGVKETLKEGQIFHKIDDDWLRTKYNYEVGCYAGYVNKFHGWDFIYGTIVDVRKVNVATSFRGKALVDAFAKQYGFPAPTFHTAVGGMWEVQKEFVRSYIPKEGQVRPPPEPSEDEEEEDEEDEEGDVENNEKQ
jgi:hypothetical protein